MHNTPICFASTWAHGPAEALTAVWLDIADLNAESLLVGGMVRHFRRRLMLRWRMTRFYRIARKIGFTKTLRLRLLRKDVLARFQLHGVNTHLLIRGNSSDIDVFYQIFIEEEYACLEDVAGDGLIIDAGANVGYSSIYFLTKFRRCRVIAVEPDADNFAVLKRNLAAYADRVVAHHTGLWSHATQLLLEPAPYRDGRAWTRQVREVASGEAGSMWAISIGDIISAAGVDHVSLLKMDIEGAEAVVFAEGAYNDWLGVVDAIAIELHDDSQFGNASEIFFSAIESEGFALSRSGELTICCRS